MEQAVTYLSTRLSQYWTDSLLPLLETLLVNILWSLIIAAATFYLARKARSSFLRAAERTRADPHTRIVGGQVVYITVLVVGFTAILGVFGVSQATLVTVLGAVGLALSLSTQEILKNFFAGLYLLFERPFRIGDIIVVKDHEGVVEDIGVRTITLRTKDNVQVLVPNAVVFAEIVANRTRYQPVPPAINEGQVTTADREGPVGSKA